MHMARIGIIALVVIAVNVVIIAAAIVYTKKK